MPVASASRVVSDPQRLLAHLPPYCSATDLSRALGPAPGTILKWATEGLFPKPIQLGGRPKFKTAEVVAFLERQEAERE